MIRGQEASTEEASQLSHRIVGTYWTSAANQRLVHTYQESGIDGKRWLSQRDDRVCEDCATLDTQVVALSEPFTIRDAELFYPGDPNGPFEIVFGCRCDMMAVRKEK